MGEAGVAATRALDLVVEGEADGPVSAQVLGPCFHVLGKAGFSHDVDTPLVPYCDKRSVDVVGEDGWPGGLEFLLGCEGGFTDGQPFLGWGEQVEEGVSDGSVCV